MERCRRRRGDEPRGEVQGRLQEAGQALGADPDGDRDRHAGAGDLEEPEAVGVRVVFRDPGQLAQRPARALRDARVVALDLQAELGTSVGLDGGAASVAPNEVDRGADLA